MLDRNNKPMEIGMAVAASYPDGEIIEGNIVELLDTTIVVIKDHETKKEHCFNRKYVDIIE